MLFRGRHFLRPPSLDEIRITLMVAGVKSIYAAAELTFLGRDPLSPSDSSPNKLGERM
jgi:hypothetical protein